MSGQIVQFFRDCSGLSRVERGIYFACLGLWLVIGLESFDAISVRH